MRVTFVLNYLASALEHTRLSLMRLNAQPQLDERES